jgi:hypothetical protein
MKDIDYTYNDTWNRRDSNMIYESYTDYLNSDWWKSVKEKASKRKCYQSCLFCKSKENLHLHHTSYKWIHTKHELRTIICLCKNCHQEVHDYAKLNLVSVRIATNIMRRKPKY